MNMPENILKEMRENTKEFKEYLKVVNYTEQNKNCPPSLSNVILIIIIFIIIILIIIFI